MPLLINQRRPSNNAVERSALTMNFICLIFGIQFEKIASFFFMYIMCVTCNYYFFFFYFFRN